MKKTIILSVLFLSVLFACKKTSETGVAQKVKLSKESIELLAGESEKISATVLPEGLGMGVTWSVEDTSYVSCTDGVVTAKKEGVTYVIATSADGVAKASCMVTVNPKTYAVTVTDEFGTPLDAIYGYPSMTMKLNAVAADGKTHTLTWSVDDETVASIDGEGNLTLGEVTSDDPAYVFFAESYIKVRTEDGCGCKIPVKSSLLRAVKVDEDFMTVMPVTLEKESTYRIALLFEDLEGLAEVPADDIELSLSDTESFTLVKSSSAYDLTTGSQMGKTTRLYVKTKLSEQSVEVAILKVDLVLVIAAELKGTTTCTLAFTWTEGKSAADDVSKAYTIALFSDSMCENKVISLDIPADAECFEGKQPCFVFGGLESGKTYFFRANETGDLERMSNVVEATTGEFTNVAYDELTTPVVGDIILAENFNEWGYGTDETMGAAGFHDNDANLKIFSGDVDMNTVSLQKPSSTGRRFFHQTNLWDTGARIAQWGFAGNSSSYLRAGYLRMTTTSSGNRTHLVTPKLAAIPSGCLATIEVTARILRTEKDNQFGVLVQTGTMSKNSASSNPLPCYKLGSLASDRKYPFDMTTANDWEVKTVTIDNITNSNSLAFGSIENVNGKNRFYIAEITVKLVDIKSASGFSASCSGKSSSTLAFKWTKGGSADADIANAYTAALYEDSACTQLNQSFDIPAGSACWNNKQPCFVFGGLKPSTTYYLKVTDTTNNIESNVAGGTTEAFTVVAMPAEVTATGVVLAEDFGELRWDYERCFDAASFFPGSTDDFSNIANPTFRKVGDGSEKAFKSHGTALGKSRLNDWVQDSNVYLHPGCLKLGTSSARGWILTPEFTVPEGKKAVVKVTVTAARHDNNQDKDWTIVVLTPELAKASPSEHSADFGWPDVADPANCQTINITDYAVWNTLSVSGLEIHHGDRIAFGGVKGASASKGRVWISDITIEVTELK